MRISVYAGALIAAATLAVTGVSPVTHAQSQNTNVTDSKVVEVKPGNTLDGIATDNSTTFHRLYDANTNIEDPDLIFPGEKLRIPAPDEQLERRTLPAAEAAEPVSVAPAPVAAAPAAASYRAPAAQPANAGVWDQLAACESGGNWAINTGNGFYGGLQFTLSSWQAAGGSGYPHLASKSEQIARAERLLAMQGWGAWPACTAKLGLR